MRTSVFLLAIFFVLENSIINNLRVGPSRRLCPRLYLPNGRVRNKPRLFAQFQCNRGYQLMGERYSKCQDGFWDSPLPICVRASCKMPQAPKFGMMYTSFRQAVLRFFCTPNYELHGPNFSYCDGKSWNTHMPSCVKTNSTPSISCDFESPEICGWTHDLNHDFSWERISNNTPSGHVGTGPKFDHTKGKGGSGYYMYIESSFKAENDTARLISPIYPKQPSTKTCLEFYYHMYGSGIGQLRTYLKLSNENWTFNDSNLVHKISGNQGDFWYRSFLDLGLIKSDFQIVFEGVRGVSYVSDIAIDDVKVIEDCNTDELTTATTEVTIDMSTLTFESCENRCFKTNESLTLPSMTISCDCDENCSDRNSCCPDFSIFCIFEYSTDVSEDTTYEDVTTSTMTIQGLNSTIVTSQTTSKEILITSPVSTRKNPVKTSTFIPIPTRTPQRTTQTKITTKPIPTTKIPTTPTTASTNSLISSSTKEYPKTAKTIRYIDDVVTFETTIYQKEYDFNQNNQENVEIDEKTKPSTALPNNSLTVKVVIICTLAIFVVLIAIFVVRKLSIVRCLKMKKMRNSNGDSQSDVRFLTSDEILDFTLATPRRRRDS